jgi:hypothetical protein
MMISTLSTTKTYKIRSKTIVRRRDVVKEADRHPYVLLTMQQRIKPVRKDYSGGAQSLPQSLPQFWTLPQTRTHNL